MDLGTWRVRGGHGVLESFPLRNERGSNSWGPRENWHQGTSAHHIHPPVQVPESAELAAYEEENGDPR